MAQKFGKITKIEAYLTNKQCFTQYFVRNGNPRYLGTKHHVMSRYLDYSTALRYDLLTFIKGGNLTMAQLTSGPC